MKSPYEAEHENLVLGFILALIILAIIILVFHKELISLMHLVDKLILSWVGVKGVKIISIAKYFLLGFLLGFLLRFFLE